MIYCGSSSYFGKALLPVPVSVLVPALDPDLFSTVFQQRNYAFLMLEREAVLFPRKLVSNLRFRTIVFYLVISMSKSGSAKAKSYASYGSGSGSTTLIVRHVTGNDQDYLRKIPRVVGQISALL